MRKNQVRLTLVGDPTLLIEMGGLRLLTDPIFDEPQVYTADELITEKLTLPAMSSGSLLPIDVVLLSHDQHRDNLDAAGRTFVPRAKIVISTLVAEGRMGGNTRGLPPRSSMAVALPG